MASISRRSSTISASPSVLILSRTSCHSMGTPVEIAEASSRSSGSSGATLNRHLLGEADEGAADCDVRSSDGWLSQGLGYVWIGMPHLDARDDRFAVVWSQALQRGLVALQRFAANRLFDRGGAEG